MGRVGHNADTAQGMPLVEHLRELRSRLVKAAVAILAGAVVAFLLRNHVIGVLEGQVCGDASINGIGKASAQCPNGVLTLSGPTAGITLAFKVAFLGGLCLSAPAWLYQFWAFLAPGLYQREKRYGVGFVALATPLFASGCALCYLFFPKIM
jgi:sec-independent protein translocase protein TatC